MKHFLPLLLAIPFLLSACGANLQGSVTPDAQEQQQDEQQQNEQPKEDRPPTTEFSAGDSLALPGFSVAGRVMENNGELIAVFEYGNDEAAEADQAKIGGDGQSVGGNAVSWVGPVHFFRHGRVIVVYVGSDENLLEKLRVDAGDQFAGN